MTLILMYIATFVIFLAIDYVGLSYLIKPIFEKDIGHLMIENFRVGPAFLFYAFFVGVLLWFVSVPALAEGWPLLKIAGNAALIGAMAYGTYEFSNLAVLKDWTWRLVIVDVAWGTAVTSICATGGVLVARMFS
jgi:uncharacterized membrane protein